MASKNTDLETEELSEIIGNKKINNDENSISSDSGMSVEKEERQHHRLPKNAQSTNFKALQNLLNSSFKKQHFFRSLSPNLTSFCYSQTPPARCYVLTAQSLFD